MMQSNVLQDLNIQDVLERVSQEATKDFGKGKVASYIPALKRVPRRKFAMSVCTLDGHEYNVGDSDESFSIQSISKVLTLAMALEELGAGLWKRVGREPSGNPFNSLVQLERENGIPRNPFINAGALVVTDVVTSRMSDPKNSLRNWARVLSGNKRITFDTEVAESENLTGDRNRAIAYFLKTHGNLKSDVESVLDLYFHQCSLSMSCLDVARAFRPLANQGMVPGTKERVMPLRRAKRINSLMMTSGVYDSAGNFAYRVGIPCKSGVGGGIAGVIPGVMSLCVWSPELDSAGNSLVGTKALELFTTKTKLSVF
ncbi:MAG: glutaminase [Rhodospirillaceae bacterium]